MPPEARIKMTRHCQVEIQRFAEAGRMPAMTTAQKQFSVGLAREDFLH